MTDPVVCPAAGAVAVLLVDVEDALEVVAVVDDDEAWGTLFTFSA